MVFTVVDLGSSHFQHPDSIDSPGDGNLLVLCPVSYQAELSFQRAVYGFPLCTGRHISRKPHQAVGPFRVGEG
jgi:hypothetical protein